MSTTAGKLRQTVRNYLFSNFPVLRPKRFVASDGECSVTNHPGLYHIALRGTGWAAGDIVENEVSGEQIYLLEKCSTYEGGELWAADRGYNSTYYDHEAPLSGARFRVLKNPRYTQYQINEAIRYVLEDLERLRVYTFNTAKFVPGDTIQLDGFIKGLSLYTYQHGRVLAYPFKNIGSGMGVPGDIQNFVERELPRCEFYVLYRKKILRPEDLMPRQVPIVPAGVVAELMAQTVAPATADPGRRTSRSVTSGQELRDTLNIRNIYLERCAREAQLLKVESRRQVADLQSERVERFRA